MPWMQGQATTMLRSLLSERQAAMQGQRVEVPDGWRLVPIEPTYEMLEGKGHYSHIEDQAYALRVWKDMVESAPNPDAATQEKQS